MIKRLILMLIFLVAVSANGQTEKDKDMVTLSKKMDAKFVPLYAYTSMGNKHFRGKSLDKVCRNLFDSERGKSGKGYKQLWNEFKANFAGDITGDAARYIDSVNNGIEALETTVTSEPYEAAAELRDIWGFLHEIRKAAGKTYIMDKVYVLEGKIRDLLELTTGKDIGSFPKSKLDRLKFISDEIAVYWEENIRDHKSDLEKLPEEDKNNIHIKRRLEAYNDTRKYLGDIITGLQSAADKGALEEFLKNLESLPITYSEFLNQFGNYNNLGTYTGQLKLEELVKR